MDTLKCYEILEITEETPPDQIRKAYVRLANIWQPDRYANSPLQVKAAEKMKEIEEAYQHLAIFIPDLKRSAKDLPVSKEPEESESALVDDSNSPVQWTLIFIVSMLLGVAALVAYHVSHTHYEAAPVEPVTTETSPAEPAQQ